MLKPNVITNSIILKRINFGEADRILTVITPHHGKVRLIAKGVRKSASKLAGGIELFSISTLAYIPGKRDISTLISTRLVTHYSHIVADFERTSTGYELLKTLDKATEEQSDTDFYELLVISLNCLNQLNIPITIVEAWFYLGLLKALGRLPNLVTTSGGEKLAPGQNFIFDFDAMAFSPNETGKYHDTHIKLLRLLLKEQPERLRILSDAKDVAQELEPLLKTAIAHFIS